MIRGRTYTLLAALTLIAGFASILPGHAQQATRLGVHESWVAFTYDTDKGKVCYIVSQPLDSEPKNVRRGEIYFMVTHRPGQSIQNEVMTMIGYNFKTGSDAKLTIGAENFDLFTQGEGAWVETSDVETKIVEAMRRGTQMVVNGTSWRGTLTVDKYSLLGVSAALDEIASACQ